MKTWIISSRLWKVPCTWERDNKYYFLKKKKVTASSEDARGPPNPQTCSQVWICFLTLYFRDGARPLLRSGQQASGQHDYARSQEWPCVKVSGIILPQPVLGLRHLHYLLPPAQFSRLCGGGRKGHTPENLNWTPFPSSSSREKTLQCFQLLATHYQMGQAFF